ncbi:MAG: tRNA pseudouridine(38-40) synthase TruA [Oscillospiraceae bacterium]|nr:tRNA pseudouridine(38-40) synthase TruA [Oscillospiraceae bacterium]
MRNLLLYLQYDGTYYHGWQIQPEDVTVQQTVEAAIFKIFKEEISVAGCSRTDAGVHAKKYALSFFTDCKIPADRVAVALNTALPCDIRALVCVEVCENFHARFDTVSKTYQYIINNGNFDVFMRNYCWSVKNKLDIQKMKDAAKFFIGKHDFKSFMTGDKDSTVRTVFLLDIVQNGDFINIFISADGFLYNMVRIITGTLKRVGEGKLDADKIPEIIKARDRRLAGETAPPQGLYLYDVKYENY